MPLLLLLLRSKMTECAFCFLRTTIKEPNDSSRNEYNVFIQEHFKDLREAK